MKANQLAALVLRLLGIYCLVQVIPVASIFTSVIFSALNGANGSASMAILAALFLISPIVIGVLLIIRSVPWGEKLISKDAGDGNISAVSFEQVQMLAFAVTGILIFAGALPQLFNSVFNLLHLLSSENSRNTDPIHNNPYLIEYAIGTLLKTALGLWLFFGACGFANFWRSLKNFGTPKPPEN
ncbi:MAG TPA: hypothetical protein VHY30_06725 [Verrucomicrobiae bacterium]|jgi:hypothetical protein|nr:hypothetical protein [Verrucomicrobiae bacterium]